MKTFSDLKEKGLTIFLTSHFMNEVEALCDKICIFKKGEIVFHGTVPEAIESSSCDKFEDAYEGAEYTFLEQSFGALATISICAGGVMGLPLVVSDYRSKGIIEAL